MLRGEGGGVTVGRGGDVLMSGTGLGASECWKEGNAPAPIDILVLESGVPAQILRAAYIVI